jgi:hypothetical protein
LVQKHTNVTPRRNSIPTNQRTKTQNRPRNSYCPLLSCNMFK